MYFVPIYVCVYRSVLIYKEYIPLRNPSFLLFSVVIVCMEVESLPSAGWLVRRVPALAVGIVGGQRDGCPRRELLSVP